MEEEEGREVGLVGVEEAADLEGEGADGDQEDRDEDIGERREEIGLQLARVDAARSAFEAFTVAALTLPSPRRPSPGA